MWIFPLQISAVVVHLFQAYICSGISDPSQVSSRFHLSLLQNSPFFNDRSAHPLRWAPLWASTPPTCCDLAVKASLPGHFPGGKGCPSTEFAAQEVHSACLNNWPIASRHGRRTWLGLWAPLGSMPRALKRGLWLFSAVSSSLDNMPLVDYVSSLEISITHRAK